MQKEVHQALVVREMRVGCSVTAIFVQKEVDSATCKFWHLVRGVVEGGFSTRCRLLVSFPRAFARSFPLGSCVDTSPHTVFEINTDPRCAKKEVCRAPLFRGMRVRCTALVTPSAARFARGLQLKNDKGCLYMHLVRHHGPERRFACSGTEHLRAVMALHQHDLFRGRRPADFLARSAELSCTSRLRVDREYRVLLTASGPRFVCKDRHLMQTGRSHAHDDEPLQCDIQLQGCQLGHMLLEHPKVVAEDIQLQGCQQGHMLPEHPMWPVAEDIVRSPDVWAWKSALYDGLRSADGFHVLSVDGTMKIAMGVCWRDVGTPFTPGSSQLDDVDAYVARCCLGPCRGPRRQQTPRCRVRPQERGAPRRSGGCALCSRGQRIAGVTRRLS